MSIWSMQRGRSGDVDAALELSWGSGICERCSSTIVLGDEVVRLEHSRKVKMCSSCAAQPSDAGRWRDEELDGRRRAFEALADACADESSLDRAA